MAPFESVVRGLEERRRELEDNFREVYPNVDIDSLAPGAVVWVLDNPDGGKRLLGLPLVDTGESSNGWDVLRTVEVDGCGHITLEVNPYSCELRGAEVKSDLFISYGFRDAGIDAFIKRCLESVGSGTAVIEAQSMFGMTLASGGLSGGVWRLYALAKVHPLEFFDLVDRMTEIDSLETGTRIVFEWDSRGGR